MGTKQFEESLGRIMAITACKTQVQLAEVLNVRQSSISDAKRRKSIPAAWLLTILTEYNINPLWIINGGHEPKFRILSDEFGAPINVEELREQVKAEIRAEQDNPHAEDLIHKLKDMGLDVQVSPLEMAA